MTALDISPISSDSHPYVVPSHLKILGFKMNNGLKITEEHILKIKINI